MKIEIVIVATHLGRSLVGIDGGLKTVLVEDLPERLGTSMICILKMLEPSHTTNIFFVEGENNESIVLIKKDGENCTPEVLDNLALQNYLQETIELLAWYFKKHFWSMHGDKLGGSWYCTDCHRLQQSKGDNKCYNWQCSSHQKMLDIDPAYVAVTENEDPCANRAREWKGLAATIKPYVRQH
jgi:hypothetical protein